MKYLPLFTEQIMCTCKKPWNMPLTAQFHRSLDYHTLSVIPRNETQRKCSIFVNIDCVFSRLYCALFFFFFWCLYIFFFGC